LLLLDVLDAHAEAAAVADRLADLAMRIPDHDADVLDAGGAHRLQAEEQDGLVADRHQLLGAGVRDGAQARPLATAQDECLDDRRSFRLAGAAEFSAAAPRA
jgi:hypothetical protein